MKILVLTSRNSLFIEPVINDFIGGEHTFTSTNEHRAQQIFELMCRHDLVWVEWCTQTAVDVSRLPKVCPIIIRLHRYESFQPYINQVNWNFIDHIIFVVPFMRKITEERL